MSWTTFLYLGNIALTLPLACAIAAWLLTARHWRAAGCWLLFFASALAIVGISKVAYLGWGTSIPVLEFQALSGHATGVTAVFPVLFYVLLQGRPGLALGAAAAGLLLGAGLAATLVATDEHTAAEAGAGWMVGAATAAGTIRVAREAKRPRPLAGLVAALLAFATTAWAMQGAHVGYWMIKAALALSGNTRPFEWGCCS